MPEEFVRKDVFDAHMQKIEALMALNLTEQRAMTERMEGKINSFREELRGDIKALDGKITSVHTELKGDIKALDGKIASVRTELKGDIKALDAKLYALEGKLSQNLVITGVIVTVFGVIITALQFWR